MTEGGEKEVAGLGHRRVAGRFSGGRLGANAGDLAKTVKDGALSQVGELLGRVDTDADDTAARCRLLPMPGRLINPSPASAPTPSARELDCGRPIVEIP